MQIGIIGCLTIIFIVLKLTGYIKWTWLWVFSPLWISFAIMVAIAIFILTYMDEL